MVDLFVNDSITLSSNQPQSLHLGPIKKATTRNILCKSVQGNAKDPEKRLKLERLLNLGGGRNLPMSPNVRLSVNMTRKLDPDY